MIDCHTLVYIFRDLNFICEYLCIKLSGFLINGLWLLDVRESITNVRLMFELSLGLDNI